MSASNIREELLDYVTFLSLTFAIKQDRDHRYEQLQDWMGVVVDFIDTATSRDVKERGKGFLATFKEVIKKTDEFMPRRKPVREIARDFHSLGEQTDVWRNGISYGWLEKRFEVKKFLPYPDLPPHAKVGVGIHAGGSSVEEVLLLEDTFLLFAQAEKAFERMVADSKTMCDGKDKLSAGSDGYRKLSLVNGQVGTFSRLAVVNAAAFVEAFVNSVGWAESERNPQRNEDEHTQLKGLTKNGRYLSLEAKLEKFPKLIRSDGVTPIILSDERQMKEPFVGFLAETKEIRDASMHYAPGKALILRPPQDWYESARRASEHAVQVAAVFWDACYPGREPPSYLFGLDHAALIRVARERVKAVEQ